MKWILIFYYLGQYGHGAAGMSIEFDDGQACVTAANVLSRAFERLNGVTITTCVPKGSTK